MAQEEKRKTLIPEWSYPVDIDSISGKAVRLHIAPDGAAREKLARRLNIVSLDLLEADLILRRTGPNSMTIHVSGHFKACVTQSCVVTLEPVKDEVGDDFEAWYADPAQAVSLVRARREREVYRQGGETPILDESEDPEPVEDGRIDLGELVTQYLSLALDPYPHAPDVRRESGEGAKIVIEPPPEARRNPFAALKDWKDKLK